MTGRLGFHPRQRLKDFSSSLCVQTFSVTHPASCTMGTCGPFPGAKARPVRDADRSPHLVPRSRINRSYTSSIPKRLHGVLWDSFNFYVYEPAYRQTLDLTLICLHHVLLLKITLKRWFHLCKQNQLPISSDLQS
jgi:hypothetical protein